MTGLLGLCREDFPLTSPSFGGGEGHSTSCAVLALRHEEADRHGHGAPLVHDLPIAEAHHPVTEACQVRIPRAVPLERIRARVVLTAIHLDHKAATDQEVDSTDTGNENLATDAPPERGQPQPEERLDA